MKNVLKVGQVVEFKELEDLVGQWSMAKITVSEEYFEEEMTIEERQFYIGVNEKYFMPHQMGYSLFARNVENPRFTLRLENNTEYIEKVEIYKI